MPTPDLPVELWLEILTYLPRTGLHKMMGVNRTLFELALNDLYEEVRFIADDMDMRKTFKQLKHFGIAKRVQSLYIRPAFLPSLNEDQAPVFEPKTLQSLLEGTLYTLKRLLKRPSALSISSEHAYEPNTAILETASKAIKGCTNLDEIALVLHDHALPPPFMIFLHSLWSSDSIGPCLRTLAIDTTVAKLPVLLKPLVKRAGALPNLSSFDINITFSRFTHTSKEWKAGVEALCLFLTTFAQGITALTFSCLVSADVDSLFGALPTLPRLLTLESRSVFNVASFHGGEHFTKFLVRHAGTLSTLVLRPRGRSASLNSSDGTYNKWIHGRRKGCVDGPINQHSLASLFLPHLRLLDVGFLTGIRVPGNDIRAILPDIHTFAPNLTALVLTDLRLTAVYVLSLVKVLAALAGGVFERLSFSTTMIYPGLFDCLARDLPGLQDLCIDYREIRLSAENGEPRQHGNNQPTFFAAMHARKYPNWKLRRLRIAVPYSCGTAHPYTKVMNAVAETLSRAVVLDDEYRCQCVENINYRLQ